MYFLYSDEQITEKNKILKSLSKRFVPGIVIYNGEKRQFTQMSEDPTIERFVDCRIVAEGDEDILQYSKPTSEFINNNN